jgi:hypothetical protein
MQKLQYMLNLFPRYLVRRLENYNIFKILVTVLLTISRDYYLISTLMHVFVSINYLNSNINPFFIII